ncbi:MAG: hypothetical protein QHJ34_06530 [bacterium]|jgi:hypothetical protein|nr:hypothetical protein [candidate division KSB1 bacterium]MDH7559876.1 hypothetical protein [bacterium]
MSIRRGGGRGVAIASAVIGAAVLLTGLSCEVEHGIAPLPGMVRARVLFYGGPPPKNTQGIYLVVAPKFPPRAINELYHSPNSLPFKWDAVRDTVMAEMALPYGHYEAISLWWYNTETKSNLADVLALPLDARNNLLPLGFDITKEEPVFAIDLRANWSRVDRDASIEGTLYFNGPFPANTLATAVAAYVRKPEVNVEYLTLLKSIDFSVGTESDNFDAQKNAYHYVLPVRHGTVEYVAVFWLPERASLTDFRVLGIYEDPDAPGQPGKLSIKAGETKKGADIFVDWAKAKP